MKSKIKKLITALIASVAFSSTAVFAEVKYSVTSGNFIEYADMLTPGQKALFIAYPDTFRIDVYDNSPACEAPDDIKAMSQSNGTLVNDNEGFEAPNVGQIPFPNPTHPQHFVWNFRMNSSYVSNVARVGTSTNVAADGSIVVGQQVTDIVFPRNPNTISQYADPNIYAMFMQKNLGPPRTAGVVTLVHDYIDSYIQPRKAWGYAPATRRVRRAPNISYDTVLNAGGGIITIDQYNGFNGAQDKYDWSYEGMKKALVPMYNDVLMNTPVEESHTRHHLNPDHVRFEERDVHVVHAQLKPGQRHLYESRTFYFMDDDYYHLALHDMYDGNGDLMRTYIGTVIAGQFGASKATECFSQGEFTFDLATRSYSGNNVFGEAFYSQLPVYNGTEEKPASFYTPDGLRRYAR